MTATSRSGRKLRVAAKGSEEKSTDVADDTQAVQLDDAATMEDSLESALARSLSNAESGSSTASTASDEEAPEAELAALFNPQSEDPSSFFSQVECALPIVAAP